jgi:hypothetical protein
MKPRILKLAAIGAIFVALMACAAPDRRAGLSLDMHRTGDATPRHFEAEIDFGVVALSLRLRWSADA